MALSCLRCFGQYLGIIEQPKFITRRCTYRSESSRNSWPSMYIHFRLATLAWLARYERPACLASQSFL